MSMKLKNRNRDAASKIKMVLLGALVWIFTVAGFSARADEVVAMEWDPNVDTNVIGYVVYCGAASHEYSVRYDVGTNSMAILPGLTAWATYYAVVTAYN